MSTYYVKNSGNDSLSGLDDTNAWETLAKVNGFSFVSGDVVCFKCGSEWNERVLPPSNIMLTKYSTGDLPIVHGTYINEKTNVLVDNIKLMPIPLQACYIGGSDNITIQNCSVDGNGEGTYSTGINVGWKNNIPSTYIIIDNCKVYDFGDIAVQWYGGGIKFNIYVTNSTIKNCTVYNNIETNIQLYSDDDNYWLNNITIENNIVYNYDPTSDDYGTGINFGFRTRNSIARNNYIHNVRVGIQFDAITELNTVYNNIVYNALESCRILANFHGNCDTTSVYNNTFIFGENTVKGMWYVAYNGATGGGHIFKNNIVVSTQSWWPVVIKEAAYTVTLDNNCYFNTIGNFKLDWESTSYTEFQTYKNASGQDFNSINVDPLLTPDFYLTSSSPCIDKGTDLNILLDYNGNTRTTTPDIGAYEFIPTFDVTGVGWGTSAWSEFPWGLSSLGNQVRILDLNIVEYIIQKLNETENIDVVKIYSALYTINQLINFKDYITVDTKTKNNIINDVTIVSNEDERY